MTDYASIIEHALEAALAPTRPAALSDAMRHAVLGTGGKRVRPRICLASAVAADGRAEDAISAACAIELLHSYTLVHDDLPAMDNDTLRRGKPSVWAAFGEDTAILAGDALQALAFREAARSPVNAREVTAELAEKAFGVVRGQVEDVAKSGDVEFIYEHKTADLFIAAARMGAWAGGGIPEIVDRLGCYARALGFAFQFRDDLLDGDSPYAREKTEALVRTYTEEARAALVGLPGDVSFLIELADRLAVRTV